MVSPAASPAPPAPFLRAAGLMLASTLSFGAMAILIRVASKTLATVEVAFFRNFFGLLVLLPLLWQKAPGIFRTRQMPRYLLRSAIGIGAMLCGFWAIGNLPMAEAIALSYSTPLFVTIFATIWLGEIVRRRRWTAVLLGFIGVLVVVRPGTAGFSAGSLVAVTGAVLSSVVAIQIKQLSRIDPPDTIVFWTYVFWVPLSLAPALFAWQWPHGIDWAWLFAIGICGTGGQLLWTRALQLGEVSALTPIGFMQLPLVAGMAWLLFGEEINRWTVLGAAIIFVANGYIAHREATLSRNAATQSPVEAAKPGE